MNIRFLDEGSDGYKLTKAEVMTAKAFSSFMGEIFEKHNDKVVEKYGKSFTRLPSYGYKQVIYPDSGIGLEIAVANYTSSTKLAGDPKLAYFDVVELYKMAIKEVKEKFKAKTHAHKTNHGYDELVFKFKRGNNEYFIVFNRSAKVNSAAGTHLAVNLYRAEDFKESFVEDNERVKEMKVRFLEEEQILTEDLMADFKSLNADQIGSPESLLYDLELILRSEVHKVPKRVTTQKKDRLALDVFGVHIIVLMQNGKFIVKNVTEHGNFDNTVSSFRTLGELVNYIEDIIKSPVRQAA